MKLQEQLNSGKPIVQSEFNEQFIMGLNAKEIQKKEDTINQEQEVDEFVVETKSPKNSSKIITS
jgi:hypothetical protein